MNARRYLGLEGLLVGLGFSLIVLYARATTPRPQDMLAGLALLTLGLTSLDPLPVFNRLGRGAQRLLRRLVARFPRSPRAVRAGSDL